jgi:hypothetical protein
MESRKRRAFSTAMGTDVTPLVLPLANFTVYSWDEIQVEAGLFNRSSSNGNRRDAISFTLG